jgi:hypothetical protein
VQEASLFLAGRVSDPIGVFAQTTYSDIDRLLTLDNVDVRYAQQTKIADKPAIFGVSVNNNPGVSDVWNTRSEWCDAVSLSRTMNMRKRFRRSMREPATHRSSWRCRHGS